MKRAFASWGDCVRQEQREYYRFYRRSRCQSAIGLRCGDSRSQLQPREGETKNRLKGFRADLQKLKIENERKSCEEETGARQQLQAMQEWIQESWKDEIGRFREELAQERAECKLADGT